MDPNDSSSTNLFSEKDRALFFVATRRLWELINNDSRRREKDRANTDRTRSQEPELQRYLDGKHETYCDEFVRVRDTLQIYGGALSIWNEVDKELVHIQDRNDYPTEYVTLLKDCSCDLNERTLVGGEWKKNDFDDVVNFMFTRSRRKVHSASLPEFLDEFRYPLEFSRMSPVEYENRCIFCSDGEVGSGVLLLRLTMAYVMACARYGYDIDGFLSAIFVRTQNGYEKLTFDCCASSPIECRSNGKEASCHSLREVTCKQFSGPNAQEAGSAATEVENNLIKIRTKYDGYIDRAIYPPDGHTIFDELSLEGLIPRSPGKAEAEVKITERFANLCRFIYRQTDRRIDEDAGAPDIAVKWRKTEPTAEPAERPKLYRWFDRSDNQGGLSKLSTYENLDVDRDCLRNYVESELAEDPDTIPLDLFITQIRFVCKVLLLSIDAEKFTRASEEPRANANAAAETISEVLRFPPYPYFIWRLNGIQLKETRIEGTSSLAHMALQLARTETSPTYDEVGYLLAGIRNVYGKGSNREVISVRRGVSDAFKELVTTTRTVFQPLMSPLMDKIYYGEILAKLTKDAEWKRIVDEMSHSMRHQFGALSNRHRSLEVAHNRSLHAEFEQQRQKAAAILSQMSEINSFLFCLMKKMFGGRLDDRDQDYVKRMLAIEEAIPLKEILADCVDTLENSLDLVGYVFDGHEQRVLEDCIPQLRGDITAGFIGQTVSAIRTGFSIVCLDLLKNALRHTRPKAPRVELSVSRIERNQRSYLAIHFKNNQRMEAGAYRFIEFDEESETWSKSRMVGIRTVKRILSHSPFSSSGIPWRLHVDPASTEKDESDVMLLVPVEDFHGAP